MHPSMTPTESPVRPLATAPNGADELAVRERWLKQRRTTASGLTSRGLIALWLGAGALVSWLFVAAFAGFGH